METSEKQSFRSPAFRSSIIQMRGSYYLLEKVHKLFAIHITIAD